MNNISKEPKYDNDYITKSYLDKQLSDSKDTINNRIENLPKSYSAPPNPPYYKDSLLSYNNKLYRCIRDKLMGLFSLNDWVVIATDDKTIIDFIDKNTRKSIPYEYIKEYGIKINMTLRGLDYLSQLDKEIENI